MRPWTIAIVAGLVGALAASGVGWVSGVFHDRASVVHPTLVSQDPAMPTPTTGSSTFDWTRVDDAVAPAVVSVTVASPEGPDASSGVMFATRADDAYVMTDSAVVADGGTVQVAFLSGNQVLGHIVGADPMSGLALIAVPNVQPNDMPTFGTAAGLEDANQVLAVGARSAGGLFQELVSSEDREVDLASGLSMQNLIAVTGSTIPTSAAGGPLLDQDGAVVGITIAIQPANTADADFQYAVPVDEAENIGDQLLSGICCTHPWLGVVNAVDITAAVAHQFGLTGGVAVGDVTPDSPASRLGLEPNDIITSFDRQAVDSTGMLTRVLSSSTPGRSTPITFVRNGRTVTTSVVVSTEPEVDPDNY